MIIKNAYYPHGQPTKIVIQLSDGSCHFSDASPFREIKNDDLRRLPFYVPSLMADPIPDYTLRFYALVKKED